MARNSRSRSRSPRKKRRIVQFQIIKRGSGEVTEVDYCPHNYPIGIVKCPKCSGPKYPRWVNVCRVIFNIMNMVVVIFATVFAEAFRLLWVLFKITVLKATLEVMKWSAEICPDVKKALSFPLDYTLSYIRKEGSDETPLMTIVRNILQVVCHLPFLRLRTRNVITESSQLLYKAFGESPMLPSDVAMGLVLLYDKGEEKQKSETDGHRKRDRRNVVHHDDKLNWDSAERVRHFVEYAGAAYGPMWVLLKDCEILKSILVKVYLKYCALCQRLGLRIDFSRYLVRSLLPNIHPDDLVHASLTNDFLKPPFYVAADHKTSSIVVSIRGTLSLEDTLTDLCASPKNMGDFDHGLDGLFAHSGMTKAANYVYCRLREYGVLETAKNKYPEYKIVVTGHSLGAGIAGLLTFMLRPQYDDVKCFAYSPPGCLLNARAAEASDEFIVSVVMANDMVGRMSYQSVVALHERIHAEVTRCTLSKAAVLGWGTLEVATNAAQSMWRALYQNVNVPDGETMGSADARVAYSMNVTDLELVEKEVLYLPGKIWHLEPTFNADGKIILLEATLRERKFFREIVVAPGMLDDHMVENVYEAVILMGTEIEDEVDEAKGEDSAQETLDAADKTGKRALNAKEEEEEPTMEEEAQHEA